MSIRQPFEITRAIAANGETAIAVQGQFMALLETAGAVEFTFDDGAFTRGRAGIQYALPGDETFRTVKFRDLSGGANSVTLITAFAEIIDQRLTVSGVVNVLVQNPASAVAGGANLAAGAGVSLGGHSTQREIHVMNMDPTGPLMVGNASSATAGVAVGPGETIIVPISGSLGLFNPNGHTIRYQFTSVRY